MEPMLSNLNIQDKTVTKGDYEMHMSLEGQNYEEGP